MTGQLKKKRSYSIILDDDKQRLQKRFLISEKNQKDVNKFDDENKETYRVIKIIWTKRITKIQRLNQRKMIQYPSKVFGRGFT